MDSALTLAKRHWRVPLVDPLSRPGARGAALADEPKALVTAKTQRASQLRPRQTVHGAVFRVAWRAAVGRW